MTSCTPVLDNCDVLLVGTSDCIEAVATQIQKQTTANTQIVTTAAEALDIVQRGSIDCVITEQELSESTGIDVLTEIRSNTTTLPVLLCTTSGSEEIARDAIQAGVTDYLTPKLPLDTDESELIDRIEHAVRSAQRTKTSRERARQFDAIFDDTHTATWVLNPDGSLARVNQTARGMIDAEIGSIVGEAFWTLPWWTGSQAVQRDVKQLVERAQRGSFAHAVVLQPAPDGQSRVLDLSVRPVENECGDIVSIVVEGVDTTDRVDLERDLRQSEELHRVTLNNMTDTILITDEDGEYTYVCPNVHFIFGYTAQEIRDLGTIEDLLGDDLFDREELAENGVLKNIECTATDKAGREHTLLVNVREVSIQDGTLLYSCRDVTKRKQREEALATLQETARDFLYAETHQEIAQHVVDDTSSVLNLDASAIYLFDSETNDLQPTAYSATMKELNGPLPTIHADGETLPSYSFVENEPLFFDDVHDADKLRNQATDLRSAAYIPLGNHGVFVVGSREVGEFEEVNRELADLLAATAEAAFDRVTRESRLREQDRELQRQNDQLTSLNQMNETIREIDQALVQAETREEIDYMVCERLTSDNRFSFAWIGSSDAQQEQVTPEAWAGAEQGYLDSQQFDLGTDSVEPAGRTAATREMTIVESVPQRLRQEAWRKEALARDYLSIVSIPLEYNDLTYGVLSVYAENQNAFNQMAQEVLAELGETIASAISAIERKNALLTTSMTRIEYAIDDSSFVLSRLAEDAACSLSYQGGAQQTTNGSYVFVTVEDASLDTVEAAAEKLVAVESVQQVSTNGTGGVLRLQLSQSFLAQELADHGAVFRSASATPSETTLVVDVPENVTVRRVTQLIEDTFAEVELLSKQTRDQATERNLYAKFFEELTDRQLEVLQTAYYSGFFESPRESSGEEIAEMLGISSSAFYKHSRTVQKKLFSAMFDEHASSSAKATKVQ